MKQYRNLIKPYLVWAFVVIVIPLILIALYAFTEDGNEVLTFSFTLENFRKFLEATYMSVIFKSFKLGFLTTVICLGLGYPLAYIISKCPEKSQSLLILLVTIPEWINMLLRTYAWMTILEKNGLINKLLGLFGIGPFNMINTSGAVVLGMVYNYLPYMILPLYTVIMKIDNRLVEAAADLGCTPAQVFSKVILPLSGPGILSGLTMVFVPAVSTFYISQKLGSTGTTLIGDVIESQFKTAYNPNLGAAMSLVLMILIFICVSVMNRFGENEEEEVMAKV